MRDTAGSDGTRTVVHGWAVYDTVTGDDRRPEGPRGADHPGRRGLRDGVHRGLALPRHRLLADPSGDEPDRRAGGLGRRTGELHPVEPPGRYWLPNLGLGAVRRGLVARPAHARRGPGVGERHLRRRAAGGRPGDVRTDRRGVRLHRAQEGRRGPDPATWYLYAGASPFAAAGRRLDLDIGAGPVPRVARRRARGGRRLPAARAGGRRPDRGRRRDRAGGAGARRSRARRTPPTSGATTWSTGSARTGFPTRGGTSASRAPACSARCCWPGLVLWGRRRRVRP